MAQKAPEKDSHARAAAVQNSQLTLAGWTGSVPKGAADIDSLEGEVY